MPKKKLVLIIGLFLILVLIAGSYLYFTRFASEVSDLEPQPQPETIKTKQSTPIPENVLEKEKLPQYLNSTSEFDANDIQGTPNKNMFPDIENPNFVSVVKESKIKGSDAVASFHVGNDYRAYPLKYITYHHIVNDKFGETPVLISYCGICNSAAAYNPIIKGKSLTFGVLGVLIKNDMVMYDKQTDSWWIQITGEAISGKYKGKKLELLPGMELVTYGDFKKAHPSGKVLQPVTKYSNFYEQFDPASFYEEKSNSSENNQVIGIEVRGKAKAYKIDDAVEKRVINDKLNGWSLLIVADPNDGGVRIFRRFLDLPSETKQDAIILSFEIKNGNLVDKETGSTWNFQGEAIAGELKGSQLERPKYLELFLFAWKGFYPKTAIYKP